MRSLYLDLRIPQSHSLKEKRAVVKTILNGVVHRFGVAASEVDHQDKWQRAGLGVATVSGSWTVAGEVLDSVERFVLSFPEVEPITIERDGDG